MIRFYLLKVETYFTDLWDSEFCLELGIHEILVYRLNL